MRTAIIVGLLLLVNVVAATAAVDPIVIRYPRPDPDLNDLDHYYAYQWRINYTIPDQYEVKRATLTYYDIWDWQVEEDHLYTRLLDGTYEIPGNGWSQIGTSGNTWRKYDGQIGGDYFNGQGTLIGDWNDPVGGRDRDFNLVYRLDDTQVGVLNTYLRNGNNIAWGIDPDCHYYNCKIEFVMELEPENQPPVTPELSTWMLLACSGLAGAVAYRRRRK